MKHPFRTLIPVPLLLSLLFSACQTEDTASFSVKDQINASLARASCVFDGDLYFISHQSTPLMKYDPDTNRITLVCTKDRCDHTDETLCDGNASFFTYCVVTDGEAIYLSGESFVDDVVRNCIYRFDARSQSCVLLEDHAFVGGQTANLFQLCDGQLYYMQKYPTESAKFEDMSALYRKEIGTAAEPVLVLDEMPAYSCFAFDETGGYLTQNAALTDENGEVLDDAAYWVSFAGDNETLVYLRLSGEVMLWDGTGEPVQIMPPTVGFVSFFGNSGYALDAGMGTADGEPYCIYRYDTVTQTTDTCLFELPVERLRLIGVTESGALLKDYTQLDGIAYYFYSFETGEVTDVIYDLVVDEEHPLGY